MWTKTSGKIQLCEHCGDKAVGSGRFCANCKTADGRRKMDEANTEHFTNHGLKFHCDFCEKQEEKRERKVERDKKFAGALVV